MTQEIGGGGYRAAVGDGSLAAGFGSLLSSYIGGIGFAKDEEIDEGEDQQNDAYLAQGEASDEVSTGIESVPECGGMGSSARSERTYYGNDWDEPSRAFRQ
jgi:hypothetical protein